ncbi:MAG: hypothetical protein RIC06_17215 [Cyclobacteriaceae bacterium]
MIRSLLIAILTIFFLERDLTPGYVPMSQPMMADSLDIELIPLYDGDSVLEGYTAFIFTPICEEDKCYAVEIDFFWDAIGRYNHYDTIPGSPLTKLEHEPFTPEEYEKLHQILSEPASVLANYKKEDLVQDIEDEGVDGVSGATINEIRESVISGAVYSCYTLWHIVHGKVVDSIQSLTYSNLNDQLVEKMVHRKDQQINYFLINIFSEEDFHDYLPHLLYTIENGQGYYAKNAIEKMPASVFKDDRAQDFFTGHFENLNYFAQISLLKKLDPLFISSELKSTLRNHLSERNSQKNELIRMLIGIENN